MPTDDYIKRSDAIAIVSELPFLDEELDIPHAEEVIMKIPAADVEPVRHGRWIDENPASFMDPRMRCSVCGHVDMPLAKWRFCPICGAKLEE